MYYMCIYIYMYYIYIYVLYIYIYNSSTFTHLSAANSTVAACPSKCWMFWDPVSKVWCQRMIYSEKIIRGQPLIFSGCCIQTCMKTNQPPLCKFHIVFWEKRPVAATARLCGSEIAHAETSRGHHGVGTHEPPPSVWPKGWLFRSGALKLLPPNAHASALPECLSVCGKYRWMAQCVAWHGVWRRPLGTSNVEMLCGRLSHSWPKSVKEKENVPRPSWTKQTHRQPKRYPSHHLSTHCRLISQFWSAAPEWKERSASPTSGICQEQESKRALLSNQGIQRDEDSNASEELVPSSSQSLPKKENRWPCQKPPLLAPGVAWEPGCWCFHPLRANLALGRKNCRGTSQWRSWRP